MGWLCRVSAGIAGKSAEIWTREGGAHLRDDVEAAAFHEVQQALERAELVALHRELHVELAAGEQGGERGLEVAAAGRERLQQRLARRRHLDELLHEEALGHAGLRGGVEGGGDVAARSSARGAEWEVRLQPQRRRLARKVHQRRHALHAPAHGKRAYNGTHCGAEFGNRADWPHLHRGARRLCLRALAQRRRRSCGV